MSSLVYLGFSVIIFIVSYGILFLITPTILGQFFSAMDTGNLNPEWLETYNELESTVRWLTPLIPTVGIFILVIKILMTASARGGDGY